MTIYNSGTTTKHLLEVGVTSRLVAGTLQCASGAEPLFPVADYPIAFSVRAPEAHLLRSSDRPIMVSVVDTHENITKLLPALNQMVDEGLIAMSDLDVIKDVHQDARSPAS